MKSSLGTRCGNNDCLAGLSNAVIDALRAINR